jgi:hypothetical protein
MYDIDDRMINVHGEVEEKRIVRRKRKIYCFLSASFSTAKFGNADFRRTHARDSHSGQA